MKKNNTINIKFKNKVIFIRNINRKQLIRQLFWNISKFYFYYLVSGWVSIGDKYRCTKFGRGWEGSVLLVSGQRV